ncbi:hypothetical protein IFM89_038468 [Coptis chinensis]|uniref:Uncharacterized protein n=1 Tax=Coptis chinensis TaxID=261450 RepID=A0A835LPZ4_9MAGN|nr:hypothetical protein IFM89_038468 [Coptis chinensis]
MDLLEVTQAYQVGDPLSETVKAGFLAPLLVGWELKVETNYVDESQAIVLSIEKALHMGWRRLWVESDSIVAMKAFQEVKRWIGPLDKQCSIGFDKMNKWPLDEQCSTGLNIGLYKYEAPLMVRPSPTASLAYRVSGPRL